jgi:hypothetical protein
MTWVQFASQANVKELVNHGRKWEVRLGDYSAFSDADSAREALAEVHHAAVNNALFLNTAESQGLSLPISSVPPPEVLAEYPDLVEKYPDARPESRSRHRQTGIDRQLDGNKKAQQNTDLLGDDIELGYDAQRAAMAAVGAKRKADVILKHWREMAYNGLRTSASGLLNPIGSPEHERLWEQGDGDVLVALLSGKVRGSAVLAAIVLNPNVVRYVPEKIVKVATATLGHAPDQKPVYWVSSDDATEEREYRDAREAARAFLELPASLKPMVRKGSETEAGPPELIAYCMSKVDGYEKKVGLRDRRFKKSYDGRVALVGRRDPPIAANQEEVEQLLETFSWKELCYCGSRWQVYDGLRGDGRSQIEGYSLEAPIPRKRWDIKVTTLEAAYHMQEEQLISREAEEITSSQFFRALEELPPKNWTQIGEIESFMLGEHISGSVTTVYVRVGERFFSMSERASVDLAHLLTKIPKDALENKDVSLAMRCAMASKADTQKGRYSGAIVAEFGYHAFQEIGRGELVRHDMRQATALRYPSMEERIPTIEYAGGRCEVTMTPKGKSNGIGR